VTAAQETAPQHGPGSGVYALLTDGTTVLIRQADIGDTDAVRQMHAQMSPENAYLRFFSISPLSAEREARRVCRPPDADHAALLAWLGDQLVGVASYEPTGKPGVAEIAFAVSDHMHGRGVATLLLEHLVSIARLRGLTAFTAETLADNIAMLRVFATAGLPVKRQLADGVIESTFPLPADEADRRLDDYMRSVARREQRADVASLRPLLEPASVAIVGASRRPDRVGHAIMRNVVRGGFAGRIYPVNPRADALEGIDCLPTVADLPEPVDVAVIAVPHTAIAAVARDCGRRGVRAIVVVTSGIEAAAGAELLAICRRYGMRLVGPNCFGIALPWLRLNATFAVAAPLPGVAGLVVQSGGIGIAVLEHLSRLGIGTSSFASVGDKYDVSSNDLLMWWEQDQVTTLAVLYVESFGSPRRFAQTARRVGRQLPVLTVIGGRSAAGQQAAASHTAAAATPLITQEALFGQAGIIATTSLGELIEATALLASQPLPGGNRVAIVSNAGGAGVLAADACGDNGLAVATLSEATMQRLRRLLPDGAAVTNPIDTTAAVSEHDFRHCIERAAQDDGVDAVLAITVPTALTRLGPAIVHARAGKPLAAVMLDQAESVRLLRDEPPAARQDSQAAPDHTAGEPSPSGADDPGTVPDHPASRQAPAAQVPAYEYPESAARALGHAVRYSAWRSRNPGVVPDLPGIRNADARLVVARCLSERRLGGWLAAADVAELLGCYGIAMVPTRPAASADEAAAVAAELGWPVVLKADVTGLVHKSDAGAVVLGPHSEADVRASYAQLAARFGDDLRQVLVQPMITAGVEVLVGVVHEPVFGPLVVFGLGGLATDVLGDHTARLTPLTDVDADEMIRGIRAAPLLLGHRGSAPVDTGAVAEILLRVSRLADDIPEVAELDLNPVIALADGVRPVDARIRLAPATPADPFLRRLR
jgi:acyl-CoA synthetase (NDP forming)/GNAT superfamily N-acetyltransferase